VYLIRKIFLGLRGIIGYVFHEYPFYFNYDKKELIDFACRKIIPEIKSFADLGGVWRINGAYTFYTLKTYTIPSAFLVDTNFNSTVIEKSKEVKNLKLVEGGFGESAVLETIGNVDAVLLFDVLLHQVQPDWNEVLKMYSTRTKCFLIFNQQFTHSEKTIRLMDLGMDEYFSHVKMNRSDPVYQDLILHFNEIHPTFNKPWKDIHYYWQWGITNNDLISTMNDFGFEMKYHKNCGQFSNFPSFENHAFIFLKK